MNQKFQVKKSDFDKIVKAITNKKPEVYIASPFFTPDQLEVVQKMENMLDAVEKPYYSPREYPMVGEGPDKDWSAKELFALNVKYLDECKEFHMNLINSGRFDIGTAWELGYRLANNPYEGDEKENYRFVSKSDDFQNFITTICELIDLPIIIDENAKPLLVTKDNAYKFEKTKKLMGYDWETLNLSSVMKTKEVRASVVLVCVDNYPLQISMAMGYFYAKRIPYTTCSMQNYGSNMMITQSSEGHIMLPAIYQQTSKNTSIQ